MPVHGYITITGEQQGLISAGASSNASLGNAWQLAHEDQIQIQGLNHLLVGTAGDTQGQRQHNPLVFIKAVDKSTPLLNSAWSTRENLTYCRIDLYRTTANGQREKYYCIELEEGRILEIDARLPTTHQADHQQALMETISIAYRKITWTHVAGTVSSDRWRESLSRIAPPPRIKPFEVPRPTPVPIASPLVPAVPSVWANRANTPPFEPIKLPYIPLGAYEALPAWGWKTYLSEGKKQQLEHLVSETFHIPNAQLVIQDANMAEIASRLGTPLDTQNPAANPIAWTATSGEVLIAVDHPDFASLPGQARAKILSTLVHEAMHASSFEHQGLQQLTDTHLANTNIDEFVTDYFAYDIYKKLFPELPYLTAYFAKDLGGEPTLWGGNLAKFMVERGSMTEEQLKNAYFKAPSSFKPMSSEVLQQWQTLAKRRVMRPKNSGQGV